MISNNLPSYLFIIYGKKYILLKTINLYYYFIYVRIISSFCYNIFLFYLFIYFIYLFYLFF